MLCSVEEAAQELHTSERRIREMCAHGRLKAVRLGRGWIVEVGADPNRRRDDQKSKER